MDTALDTLKTAFKKVTHKTDDHLTNKIADAVTKSSDDKTRPCWKNYYSAQKKRRNIEQIKTSIVKIEHYKMSKILNDSTVSKFVTKKWIEVSDLSSGQYSVNKNKKFITLMLRSDLCDCSDAYIVVKRTITVKGENDTKIEIKN